MMFKLVTIHMTEPICLCLRQQLRWNTQASAGGGSLHVWCSVCGTKVLVPHKQFVANFHFDKPYPGKPAQREVSKPDVLAGDVADFVGYLRRRRQTLPS
jgi:hypothetical protein